MRALSLWRPWPELIIRCWKRVENRTWSTKYRGTLLLHAAKPWQQDAFIVARSVQLAVGDDLNLDVVSRRVVDHPVGVVAVADLIDVCTTSATADAARCDCGPWAFPGQCHWRLTNVRPLPEPIECPGHQGLWIPTPDLRRRVEAALATSPSVRGHQ